MVPIYYIIHSGTWPQSHGHLCNMATFSGPNPTPLLSGPNPTPLLSSHLCNPRGDRIRQVPLQYCLICLTICRQPCAALHVHVTTVASKIHVSYIRCFPQKICQVLTFVRMYMSIRVHLHNYMYMYMYKSSIFYVLKLTSAIKIKTKSNLILKWLPHQL